jgi:hypothetical protein
MSARGYRMRVTTVDRNGRRRGPIEWVDVPAAERFPSGGISQIGAFVRRVLRSPASSAWIVISTPSGRTAISIGKHEGAASFGVSTDVRKRSRERALRSFFAARRIQPTRDYLAANGRVQNSTRVLEFPAPRTATSSAKIAGDLLRTVYGLTDRSALDIRFSEKEQPDGALETDASRRNVPKRARRRKR